MWRKQSRVESLTVQWGQPRFTHSTNITDHTLYLISQHPGASTNKNRWLG